MSEKICREGGIPQSVGRELREDEEKEEQARPWKENKKKGKRVNKDENTV
jgi:hypothetical protein